MIIKPNATVIAGHDGVLQQSPGGVPHHGSFLPLAVARRAFVRLEQKQQKL